MTKRKEILISFLFIISLVLPIIAFSKDEEACRHLEVPIPGLTSTCLPALPDYIVAIYNFALMIIGIICFGALLYGGFRYLISAGNPTVMADARDQIFSAILGLIILFSSYLILTTINPELVILREKPIETRYCTKKEDCPSQTCEAGRCNYSLNICDESTPCPPLQCIEGFCSVLASTSWSTGCSAYFTSDVTEEECPDYCQWCPKCSENEINQWRVDKCVEQGTDCGYHCVEGECEAETCE